MSSIAIVIAKLKAVSGVTTLVPITKIFPIKFPQALPLPSIIVNRVGNKDEQLLEGAASLFESRVRLEIMGEDGDAVEEIGDAVMEALKNVVKQTIAGHAGTDIYFADIDFTDSSDDRQAARRTMDFAVRWQ